LLLLPGLFKSSGTYLLVGLISAFLVILEPDLGTGLIIAASVIIGSFVKMLKGRNTNMIWTVIIAAIVVLPVVFSYSLELRQGVVARIAEMPTFHEHWKIDFKTGQIHSGSIWRKLSDSVGFEFSRTICWIW